MEGICIAWRLLQELSIKCLGALQPSGPMMFKGDGQVGSRGRLAPPICAITAARHIASIPPPISAEVSADTHQDALSDNMQQGLPERLSFGVLRSAFRIPLNAKQRSIRRSRDLSF